MSNVVRMMQDIFPQNNLFLLGRIGPARNRDTLNKTNSSPFLSPVVCFFLDRQHSRVFAPRRTPSLSVIPSFQPGFARQRFTFGLETSSEDKQMVLFGPLILCFIPFLPFSFPAKSKPSSEKWYMAC
jgi:hypothetical protein